MSSGGQIKLNEYRVELGMLRSTENPHGREWCLAVRENQSQVRNPQVELKILILATLTSLRRGSSVYFVGTSGANSDRRHVIKNSFDIDIEIASDGLIWDDFSNFMSIDSNTALDRRLKSHVGTREFWTDEGVSNSGRLRMTFRTAPDDTRWFDGLLSDPKGTAYAKKVCDCWACPCISAGDASWIWWSARQSHPFLDVVLETVRQRTLLRHRLSEPTPGA
jgi:hypothetical protein